MSGVQSVDSKTVILDFADHAGKKLSPYFGVSWLENDVFRTVDVVGDDHDNQIECCFHNRRKRVIISRNNVRNNFDEFLLSIGEEVTHLFHCCSNPVVFNAWDSAMGKLVRRMKSGKISTINRLMKQ